MDAPMGSQTELVMVAMRVLQMDAPMGSQTELVMGATRVLQMDTSMEMAMAS